MMRVMMICLLLLPGTSWAALPLITDDTKAQGKGKFQIEIAGEYDRDRETFDSEKVREGDYIVTPTVTYGVSEAVDVFISVPYNWSFSETEGNPANRVHGIADSTAGIKWLFFEQEHLSLAVKPIVTIPTGNEENILGTGKVDYGAVFIMTGKFDPAAVHANLSYVRNENKIDEHQNLWHASLAGTYEVMKNVKVCADIGLDTNRDKTSEVEPAYLIGGIIYSAGENLDFSFGVKWALHRAEADWAVLPGLTYRF